MIQLSLLNRSILGSVCSRTALVFVLATLVACTAGMHTTQNGNGVVSVQEALSPAATEFTEPADAHRQSALRSLPRNSVDVAWPQPGETLAEISVHSGHATQAYTPVSADLQGVELARHEVNLQLYEVTDGNAIAVSAQLMPGSPDRLAWILAGETPAYSERLFVLRALNPSTRAPSTRHENTPEPVRVDDDGKGLTLRMQGKPVLRYVYTLAEVPEGVNEIFRRSGFIHPLWSPGGMVLSRIQPPDHYHHYGIWNPWTQTEFEGRIVDFWNLGKGEGTVQAGPVLERVEGPVFGGFRAALDHVDFTGDPEGRTAVREQWQVRVWQADEQVWVVDFESTLNAATDQPLIIKEYRYQGFSLRATEAWHDDNTDLLTSEGFDKSNANATRARWIDVRGESTVAEGTSGVLFLTHPGNFNYPEQLRIWPTGANNGRENVYVNFNPAQDRDMKLSPGETHVLKYRMIVYDGVLDAEQAEAYASAFARPPQVQVRRVDDRSAQGAE